MNQQHYVYTFSIITHGHDGGVRGFSDYKTLATSDEDAQAQAQACIDRMVGGWYQTATKVERKEALVTADQVW